MDYAGRRSWRLSLYVFGRRLALSPQSRHLRLHLGVLCDAMGDEVFPPSWVFSTRGARKNAPAQLYGFQCFSVHTKIPFLFLPQGSTSCLKKLAPGRAEVNARLASEASHQRHKLGDAAAPPRHSVKRPRPLLETIAEKYTPPGVHAHADSVQLACGTPGARWYQVWEKRPTESRETSHDHVQFALPSAPFERQIVRPDDDRVEHGRGGAREQRKRDGEGPIRAYVSFGRRLANPRRGTLRESEPETTNGCAPGSSKQERSNQTGITAPAFDVHGIKTAKNDGARIQGGKRAQVNPIGMAGAGAEIPFCRAAWIDIARGAAAVVRGERG